MKIKSVMTVDATACRPGNTLNEAARSMREHDCGALPVVESEKEARGGELVGMITDRDIALAAHRKGKSLMEIEVREAMSRGAETCAPDDEPAKALEKMRKARVRRLPVVGEDGRLRGMLTLAQLARAATDGGRPEIREADVGATLGEICQPWPAPRRFEA